MSEAGDGIRAMVPREAMSDPARRLRDVYAMRSGAPLYHSEDLGYFSIDAWREQGMPEDVPRQVLFHLDLAKRPACYRSELGV